MRKVRTREELSKALYFTQTEIARLLEVSRPTAKRIYDFAYKIDEELPFRIYETKVSKKSLLQVLDITSAEFEKNFS